MSDLVDYFRKTVTLPKDEVTVYTNGAAAWEHAELTEQIEDLKTRQATLLSNIGAAGSNKVTRGIADADPAQKYRDELDEIESEIEKLEAKVKDVLEELSKTGVVFSLRAMYPVELEVADKEARRKVNRDAKGESLSEEEKNELVVQQCYWNYLEKSVQKVVYPDGKEVEAPFKDTDFKGLEEYLDASEYARLTSKVTELNTKAAIRNAQSDASFPGGRAEQAGES